METLGTVSVDDDLFSKASMGTPKAGKHVSFDDDLGGISGESYQYNTKQLAQLFPNVSYMSLNLLTPKIFPSNRS